MAKSRNPRSKKSLRIGTLAVIAIIAGGLSYGVASSDLAYGAQSLLAAAVGAFSSTPTIAITRNAKTPSGTIPPDSQQVIGAFDVNQYNMSFGYLTDLAVKVSVADANLNLRTTQFSVRYGYCLTNECSTEIPVSAAKVKKNGNAYDFTLGSLNLPVTYRNGVGTIFILAYPYYPTTFNEKGAKAATIKADIVSASGTGNTCKTITYGIKNTKYSYSKCGTTLITVDDKLAYGNKLTVRRGVGYGYGYYDYTRNGTLDISDVNVLWGVVQRSITCPLFKICNVDGLYSPKDGSAADERDVSALSKKAGVSTPPPPSPTSSEPTFSMGTPTTVCTAYSTTTGFCHASEHRIPFTVTAGSSDVYIGNSTTFSAVPSTGSGLTYTLIATSTPGASSAPITNVSVAPNVTGDVYTASRVPANSSRTFTLVVMVSGTAQGLTGFILTGIGYGSTFNLGSVFTSGLSNYNSPAILMTP
jgi:hypothetical protein